MSREDYYFCSGSSLGAVLWSLVQQRLDERLALRVCKLVVPVDGALVLGVAERDGACMGRYGEIWGD